MNSNNIKMLSSHIEKYQSLLIRTGIFALICSVAILIGLFGFGITHELVMRSKILQAQAGPQLSESDATPQTDPISGMQVQGMSIPEVEPALTPWDGVGRVTILLLGLDMRDWETGRDYSRSDTMILLTLDPLSHSAGILSVPRDLWVAIPGFKHGKINTAYYLGAAYKLPGGGPGLAVQTVEQFLGVPINYYAQIDFGAFVKFIDEIGGVKIDVPEAITVDLLGSGSATKKTLQPGVQVLPGEWALAYARARYTEGGDFDRASRQQQVIMGIRDRILSLDMLPVLLGKANSLYQQLASGIHTNLNLEEATKLAVLASQIPKENIRQGIIGKGQVLFGRSPDDLSILIPIIDKIHVLRDDIFTASGALGPLAPGTALEKMIAENAQVSILNGSSQSGLGQETAAYLQGLGINVMEVNESAQRTTLTSITDNSGKPYTLEYLVDLIGINPARISARSESATQADIELIIGDDWSTSDRLP
jgi:LCP family protein required for cell wall assembly